MTYDPDLARRAGRAELYKRSALLLAVLLMTASLAVGLVTLVSIRHTQQQSSPVVKRVEKLTEIIRGCVTPGADCYDNGQATAKSAVESVNEITILAINCADLPGQQSLADIRACVLRNLTKKR